MAKKKIGDIDEDLILTGGLVLGGWLLFKHIFPNSQVSAADRQTLDDQQSAPAADNVFNAYSSQAGAYAASLPDWGGYDNFDDYLVAAYAAYTAGNLPSSHPLYSTLQIYAALNTALIGHFYNGDQSQINSALNQITSQGQLSIISNLFLDINGVDLWSELRNGSFIQAYGLNGTDLASQVKKLNSLPQ